MRAGGEHEQRLAVGVEDQRVGDLADLDAERRGRRDGRVHPLGQHDHLAGRAGRDQRIGDLQDSGMVRLRRRVAVGDRRTRFFLHPDGPARAARLATGIHPERGDTA